MKLDAFQPAPATSPEPATASNIERRTSNVAPALAAIAIVGAAIYALLPSSICFASVTLSETAFTFFLMLGVWLLIEAHDRDDWRWLLAAGIVIGYATLIRGQAALIPLLALPLWLRSMP